MRITIDTSTGVLEQAQGDEIRQIQLYSKEAFETLSREWIRVGWSQGHFATFSWLGRPLYQLPDDVIRIQEVIVRLRPDVIIETGIAKGGSLLFYAGLCTILDQGRVIGIDIAIDDDTRQAVESHPLAPRITLIEGSSIDPIVVARVREAIVPGEVVLIILDADHSRAHVAAELDAYAPLVTPDSYIVAADGLMADMVRVPGIPADWAWDNPATAAIEFAASHPEFIIEQPAWTSNLSVLTENVTHWPHGWLRRRPTHEVVPAATPAPAIVLPRQPELRHLPHNPAARSYLDLMKRCLTDLVYTEHEEGRDEGARTEGRDLPAHAHTMIGLKRLENIQRCVEDVLANGVPGDLIETGVWRGGASIFMRAALRAYNITNRRVWVADSFAGLPPPDSERYAADTGLNLHLFPVLAVSLDQVRANFTRYGLLDDQVSFIQGWFRDTLPVAPIEQLAVLRLDGDLYESTMDALTHLYPKLSPGGYVIIDDYGAIPACQQAVHDYRDEYGIRDPIATIDWTGVYWQRSP